ncbi:unnamed protein product [Linum trigynum]|uniref:Peptidylprolyl isomerase n=1 Tax=Linum trigynum TaxID=586398 RepID=A0AAV2DML0_9ROSI
MANAGATGRFAVTARAFTPATINDHRLSPAAAAAAATTATSRLASPHLPCHFSLSRFANHQQLFTSYNGKNYRDGGESLCFLTVGSRLPTGFEGIEEQFEVEGLHERKS